jgi:hypothetical protein
MKIGGDDLALISVARIGSDLLASKKIPIQRYGKRNMPAVQ